MKTEIPDTIPDITQPDIPVDEIVTESHFVAENYLGESLHHVVHSVELPDGTPMAVKTPSGEQTLQDPDSPELFEEADKWAEFDDEDFVVGLYGQGETERGTPFIAMEYMDVTLESYLRNSEIGSLQHRLWIIDCLCDALETAHSLEVAHQDIKPKNIMFRRVADGWDVPKLGDWGSAAKVIKERNQEKTPKWAAPEQTEDESLFVTQKKIDVYQFGMIMYLLLTGEFPFRKHSPKPPEDEYEDYLSKPSEIMDGINSELDALTMDCLAWHPDDRPITATEIQNRLDEITDGLFDSD
jgi:serine/threonine protein kinase